MRNTEAHLRWLGAQLSFFLNFPAFAGAAFRLITPPGPRELALLCVGSVLFAIANFFLFYIIQRDSKHLALWNDKLDEIERVNKIEGGVEIFSSRRYRRMRNSRQRLQRRLEFAMVACIVGWALFAVVAGIMLVRTGGLL